MRIYAFSSPFSVWWNTAANGGVYLHGATTGTCSTRTNRWSKAGVLQCVFVRIQVEQIIQVKVEAISLDCTIVKVHPDGTVALINGP
jgi:hypothetical protein